MTAPMAKTASASSEFRTDYYLVATRAITKHPILEDLFLRRKLKQNRSIGLA